MKKKSKKGMQLMFTEQSFEVFEIAGLDERMAAIRASIQPVFQAVGEEIRAQLEEKVGQPLYLHIAQHRRRTVYPPESTWLAIGTQKRGYKMEAHFQLAIWDEYVGLWLSIIDQPKVKDQLAQRLTDHKDLVQNLPKDFVLSPDHTQPTVYGLKEMDSLLEHFATVKKSELQIGRIIKRNDPIWQTPAQAQETMLATYQTLLPLFQLLHE